MCVFKTALKIWQIVSVAGVLVLDMWYFVDFVKSHQEVAGWIHYNCFAEIIVSSSNFKKFWANFHFMAFAARDESPKGIWLWIFIFMLKLLLIVMFPLFVTHFLPGIVCYCWIWIPTVVILLYLLKCSFTCSGIPSVLFIIFGTGFKNKGNAQNDYAAKHGNLQRSPLVLIATVIALFMVPSLSMSYWYRHETHYIEAFVEVMTQRSVRLYITNITDRFASTFRFLTTIF